jgi:tellurite resistance protein TerC
MIGSIWLWVGFTLVVLALLALDLGVFHRQDHAVSTKEAAIWTLVWISLALLFNGAIYLFWDWMMPGSAASNS